MASILGSLSKPRLSCSKSLRGTSSTSPGIFFPLNTLALLAVTVDDVGPIPQFGFSVPLNDLRSTSEPVMCPMCGVRTLTFLKTSSVRGLTKAIRSCLLASKVVEHKCGHCKVVLARWRSSSGRTVVVAEKSAKGSLDMSMDGISHSGFWHPLIH